jgi:hypothetical protein
MMTDLPAPVSPVMTLNEGPNSISASSTMARFCTESQLSMIEQRDSIRRRGNEAAGRHADSGGADTGCRLFNRKRYGFPQKNQHKQRKKMKKTRSTLENGPG